MSTGALKMCELWGLLHVFSQPNMPKQADNFHGMVRERITTNPDHRRLDTDRLAHTLSFAGA
jgi:hypothetical protein